MRLNSFLLILFALMSTSVLAKEKRPNLLFIITDQQRFDAISCAGNPVVETPNMDRIAKEGVIFKNAYVTNPVCVPSRASILTGLSPVNVKVEGNGDYTSKDIPNVPTFDSVLKRNGYAAEYYGKWHSQSSHAEVYKNPTQRSQNGKSIFEHGGQNHVYMDYINANFEKRELKPGELYDTFTKRPYETDPLDKHHGVTFEAFTAANQDQLQH